MFPYSTWEELIYLKDSAYISDLGDFASFPPRHSQKANQQRVDSYVMHLQQKQYCIMQPSRY